MNLEPNRRIEHQQVISLLKAAQEPPADADTPDLPAEVLESLRGQYGHAPRRAIVEDQPSVWEWLCDWLIQPRLAFAVALALLCGTTAVMLRPSDSGEDLLRGGQTTPAIAPAYWLQSTQNEPAPSGLGLPKFIVIPAGDPVPATGNALIFDPAHREARAIKGNDIMAKITIADPTDSNEWLTAHRQLSKLPAP